MMRGRTLVALAAGAVLLALPGTAQAQLDLKPCGSIQCGRVTVPLDRSGATPGSVSLYVQRQRARRRPARGVTMLLAGGPGQPSTFAYNDGSDDPYGEFGALSPRNDDRRLRRPRHGTVRAAALSRARTRQPGRRRVGGRRLRAAPRPPPRLLPDERLSRRHGGRARGARRRQADPGGGLVRDLPRPGLRGALPDPRRPRAARLGARRVRLGPVLHRHLRRRAARAAGRLPPGLPGLHRRRGGRPGQARQAPGTRRAARPRHPAERPAAAQLAHEAGAVLHDGLGRPRRDPARLFPRRGELRPARRRRADAAPQAPRGHLRGRRVAARVQLGAVRRDDLRGDPVPLAALLGPRQPLRPDPRRRGGGSRPRRSTRSTPPPTRATTSCACAAAGPRRRPRPPRGRRPGRCPTCRC